MLIYLSGHIHSFNSTWFNSFEPCLAHALTFTVGTW